MIIYVGVILIVSILPQLPPLSGLFLITPLLFFSRISLNLRTAILAVLVAAGWGHWQLAHRLDSQVVVDLHVEGQIEGLPDTKGTTLRFNLVVHQTSPLDVEQSTQKFQQLRRLRLTWYRASQELSPGDKVNAVVRLRAPYQKSNPEGFDYARWALSRSIDAVGYIRSIERVQSSDHWNLSRWRQVAFRYIASQFSDPEVQATLAALLLGIKSELSDKQWDDLQRTGTLHLVVISGMHIGFIALVCLISLRWLLPVLSPLRQDHRLGVVCCALAISAVYVLVSGIGVPAQRAWLMLLALLSSYLLLTNWDRWLRWWFALAVVLSFSPLAGYEAGFWLSFAAVAVLLFATEHKQRSGKLLQLWRLQLAIVIGLLPLLTWWFSATSVLSPLVNIIAIPWMLVTLIVSVVCLALSALGLDQVLVIPNVMIGLFWSSLNWVGQLDFSYLPLPTLGLPELAMALVGAVLLLLPKGIPARWLGLFFFMPLITGGPVKTSPLDIWVFDVGQGLSVLARSGPRTLLYDTGPEYRNGGSAFKRVVQPVLEQKGITKLDLLILSHADNDHAGGRHDVLSTFIVNQTISGSQSLVAKPHISACVAGQSWLLGDLSVEVLAGSQGNNENERSCVVRLSSQYCSLLLTGDIGFEQESRLTIAPVGWLLASHHGSRYGTGDILLEQSRPNWLIFSAGKHNRFNHPHPDVKARAAQRQISMLSTATDGAVHLYQTADNRCVTESYRKQHPSYWSQR